MMCVAIVSRIALCRGLSGFGAVHPGRCRYNTVAAQPSVTDNTL
ncbi:hypothetical protein D805_0018 [Bifidobacterium thermophilum RBL67]|uniref:Uncharacterized protein n=1 Tax=Bifidobacterium thermophilum RBL67 TaxID=1254439 RepID=M4RA14_9BIFI|nr:hypothetical protein D805_0018 [Bifidobacterium thermophilum RBL67]